MRAAPFHGGMARGPEGGAAIWLRTEDDRQLRLGLWPGPDTPRGTVFILPGRSEYIEKYGPAATRMQASGYASLAIDWRGQGLSDRLLDDPVKGHITDYAEYQCDLRAVLDYARAHDLPRPWLMLAHSMGGAIGLRHLMGTHDFAACAFSAPMWGVQVPRALRGIQRQIADRVDGRAIGRNYAPGMTADTYVYRAPFTDNMLTRDPEMWAFMIEHLAKEPGLIIAGATLQWAAASILECAELAQMPSPDLPCYTGIGTHERIVLRPPVIERMARWPQGRLDDIDGAEHELMMEIAPVRDRFYAGCAALFERVTPQV